MSRRTTPTKGRLNQRNKSVLLCIYSTRYMSAEVRRVGGYVLRHTLAMKQSVRSGKV